ncbi:MAG: hypothetical protein C0473_01210 [Cyanobacteria bacterium DS3.002]|nr:hypothetical protein [Cyanobacteria bacterium DS3.002]
MDAKDNQSFTEIDSTRLIDSGVLIINDVLESNTIEAAQQYGSMFVERTLARHGQCGNAGQYTYRSENILGDFLLQNLLCPDVIWKLLYDVLGKNFHLVDAYVHFSLPSSTKQELHLDVNHLWPSLVSPPFLIAVHYPLCSFSTISGATRVIPNTHKTMESPPSILEEPVSYEQHTVLANPGDAFVRDCRAWHAAGANSSNEIRTMFSFAFSSEWFREKGAVSSDLYFAIPLNKRSIVRRG